MCVIVWKFKEGTLRGLKYANHHSLTWPEGLNKTSWLGKFELKESQGPHNWLG